MKGTGKLKEHYMTHANKKEISCNTCGKGLNCSAEMKGHIVRKPCSIVLLLFIIFVRKIQVKKALGHDIGIMSLGIKQT